MVFIKQRSVLSGASPGPDSATILIGGRLCGLCRIGKRGKQQGSNTLMRVAEQKKGRQAWRLLD